MALTENPVTGRLDIETSQGAYRAFPFTICNASGLAVTGWSGNDTLSVQAWRGDSLSELDGTGVTANWTDAANGVITVKTDGTHELLPASYNWRLLATNANLTYEVVRGSYTVKAAPGDTSNSFSAKDRPYTTIEDLRTVAPWIEQLKSEFDQAGFAEHQVSARHWFDNIVMRSYSNRYNFTRYTTVYGSYWNNAQDEPPQWLRTVVESGRGVQITPAIVRACALYTCHLVCQAQVSFKDDSSAYRKKSAEFRSMAANAIASMTIRVKSSLSASAYDTTINTNISVRL